MSDPLSEMMAASPMDAEEIAGELIEKSFLIEDCFASVRVNTTDQPEAEMATLPVWVARDMNYKSAPSAYVGVDESGQKILMLNAGRLEGERQLARLFLQLGSREMMLPLDEARRIVERACAACGVKEADAEARAEILLMAAKTASDTRQSYRQKALSAARAATREVLALAAAPVVPRPNEDPAAPSSDDAASLPS
jgi:hypothetical protein